MEKEKLRDLSSQAAKHGTIYMCMQCERIYYTDPGDVCTCGCTEFLAICGVRLVRCYRLKEIRCYADVAEKMSRELYEQEKLAIEGVFVVQETEIERALNPDDAELVDVLEVMAGEVAVKMVTAFVSEEGVYITAKERECRGI